MVKLYIITRTDMASMNSGRTAAQAAHAANYFVQCANILSESLEDKDDPFIQNFNEWQNETPYGFGTTIVLDGGTPEQIGELLEKNDEHYLYGEVRDPEYPIQDGNVIHIIPNVSTCWFAFPYGRGPDEGLRGLKLYGKD